LRVREWSNQKGQAHASECEVSAIQVSSGAFETDVLG
jgi:hypothetical protein